MKTIREHLETLPEPYRSQALENASPTMLDDKASTPRTALILAFNWKTSPEKDQYWDNFLATL